MTEIQVYPPEKQKKLRKDSHASHKQPQEERPLPTRSPADVQAHFLDTDLIVMWWQLVKKLLYARFFSRAVDIGNLVLGQAAVVLVHLGNKRGDSCQWGSLAEPMPLCPASSHPLRHQALSLPQDSEQGNTARSCFGFVFFCPPRQRGGSPGEVGTLPFALSASIA